MKYSLDTLQWNDVQNKKRVHTIIAVRLQSLFCPRCEALTLGALFI